MPTTRRLTQISAILFLVGWLINSSAPANLFGFLQEVGLLGLLVAAIYYLFRGIRSLRRKLLWKVRNKIIISYLFVGILPVLLLGVISWFSIRLVLGQLSALYLDREVERITETLHHFSETILLTSYREALRSETGLRRLLGESYQNRRRQLQELDNVRLILLEEDPSRASGRWRTLLSLPTPTRETYLVPSWARAGFRGLILEEDQLLFRCAAPLYGDYVLLVELPVDAHLAEQIQRRTSIQLRVGLRPEQTLNSQDVEFWDFFRAEENPWVHIWTPTQWTEAGPRKANVTVLLSVPLRVLYDYYFIQPTGLGRAVLGLIAFLMAIFLLVELVSLLIGFTIARSITSSVHNIYAATRRFQEGDFAFRVPSRNRDQLDSMAEAFNEMGDSIVRLMSQASEKQRLEKEIEIAREVQSHLFPQVFPQLPGLQISGACLPARRVSGDYYDFIVYDSETLDIVVSDISGKGISAALLMASLHSCIRTQLIYRPIRSRGNGQVARAVREINRQLYRHTAPDKFATLVFSRYHAGSRRLTYCNAGHNPPLLVSRQGLRKLSAGGMVAGLFEDPDYREDELVLEPEDLVFFYTDGIIEAENARGEQFGEARLLRLLQENAFLTATDIQSMVLAEVSSWVAGGEQRDDMTVVVLKVEPS